MACCQYGITQNLSADAFMSTFLTENRQYFDKVKLNNSGILEIQAKDSIYAAMDQNKKSVILVIALKNWAGDIVFVHSGYIREIWKKDQQTGTVALIGHWDLNNAEMYKYLPKTLQTTKYHPWFFYVGGQTHFNSDNLSLMLSTRIGAFLFKDRWDLAISASVSISESELQEIYNIEIGPVSKLYFPIRKYNISPYIGGGVAYVYSGFNMDTSAIDYGLSDIGSSTTNYWRTMALLGISWYVGPGSLDVGTQFGDYFSLTLGYTFSF